MDKKTKFNWTYPPNTQSERKHDITINHCYLYAVKLWLMLFNLECFLQ
jgi:hypothetical protein